MIKLYFAPRSRSTRPRWMLEELGVPYELVRLDLSKQEHKRPEYLAVHPHGLVPALVDGETTMIESVAICAHLADKFPEKGLAPALGTPERALYMQWLFYAVATIEPQLVKYFESAIGPEPGRNVQAAKEAREAFEKSAQIIERALGSRELMIGSSITTVDIIFGSMLAWARSMKLLEGHTTLEAYVKRLCDRPAYRRAQA